jgi:hypothetical protein
MVGSRGQQALAVGVAAHHPVQEYGVGRRHRPRVLGEVVEAPVDPPLEPGVRGKFTRLVLAGGSGSRF